MGRVKKGTTLEERFWSKVNKNGPWCDELQSNCWEWTSATTYGGYGLFSLDGRMKGAPQVAYLLTFGRIREGQVVFHECANIGCQNPAHFTLTTRVEAMRRIAYRTYQKRDN